MVDEIKLDGFSIPVNVNKKTDEAKVALNKPQTTTESSVTVNNDVGRVVKLMVAEYDPAADTARVAAMKDLVKGNQYQVDKDALAQKLTNLFLKRTSG